VNSPHTAEPAKDIPDGTVAARLLAWFDQHGRHDLPWQRGITPYRVWVSEIMLQQTQVGTVIPYFERFMAHFRDVRELADAPIDDVLHHWTGLGYYARARNLHRAAQKIRDDHAGVFPDTLESLCALPGVGRSTAGAILSIACGVRAPILDGNVKRVLTRHCAIEGDTSRGTTLEELWRIAESLTPQERCAHYTQAIMDLGATLCTRSRPACALCPLAASCIARAEGTPTRYPSRKQSRRIPERRCQMLVIRNPAGEFLLEQRPPAGIWGGLWSFPEIDSAIDAATACDRIAGEPAASLHHGTAFRHTFSHFHLDVSPVHIRVAGLGRHVLEDQRLAWYKPGQRALGLAAPVKKLIDALCPPETAHES
jgi:A/G-specific adenine glycosylase